MKIARVNYHQLGLGPSCGKLPNGLIGLYNCGVTWLLVL